MLYIWVGSLNSIGVSNFNPIEHEDQDEVANNTVYIPVLKNKYPAAIKNPLINVLRNAGCPVTDLGDLF